MFLDTTYDVIYINYNNLDFNNSTSTDTYDKIYSYLDSALRINIDNLEFKLGFSSLGEFGTTTSQISTFTYSWQKNLPYPNINFLPWLNEFYVRYIYNFSHINFLNIDEINISFIVGRHRKEIIKGMVLGDNGIGFDGVSFNFNLGKYLYIDSFFSRYKSSFGFINNKNFDIYSFLVGSRFYNNFDFGVSNTVEEDKISNLRKVFYELFIKREVSNYYYIFEYAFQGGKTHDGKNYTGSLWFFEASTKGKNRYLGESEAGLIWLLSSGGDDVNIFYPTFSKKYYFLEPYGFGEFAKANLNSIFFDLPEGYSGIFVLGFNLSINPLKKLFIKLGYYLFSSPSAPDNKPEPSATEKTLGAKKAIGVEYDIIFDYKFSNFLNISFSYSIFNPTKDAYQEKFKNDNATKLGCWIRSRF
ncbi:MAG: hypothetical protein N2505_05065 [Endomicrobia bacterium]|nr:hypothetical protein [Endomicrobiia bacterium]